MKMANFKRGTFQPNQTVEGKRARDTDGQYLLLFCTMGSHTKKRNNHQESVSRHLALKNRTLSKIKQSYWQKSGGFT